MKKNNQKNDKRFYYMYGKHAVIAALNNPKRLVENVFCSKDHLMEFNVINKFKYEIVNNEFLNKLLGLGHIHQGIVAKVKEIFLNNVHDLDLSDNEYKIAILDQITDPQNIGSIIRSAAAFNINAIIMAHDHSPEECGSMAKAASGTLEIVKMIRVINIKQTIEFLKKEGFWIIGLAGQANQQLNKKLLSGRIAIALGSEDKGLRRLTQESCDYLVKIPMANNVESLNVANAATIVFSLSYQS